MNEPPIDFEPTKTGFRLRRPRWSDPDDPRLYWAGAVVMACVLGFIWWKRDEFGIDVLFGVAAMFGGFFGALLMLALNERD